MARRNPAAMSETRRRRRWVAALLLTLAMLAFGIVLYCRGHVEAMIPLGIGTALGSIYVCRGGSLPASFYSSRRRGYRSSYRQITREDDPRNLPARIYLPIVLAVLAIAGLCFWLFLR